MTGFSTTTAGVTLVAAHNTIGVWVSGGFCTHRAGLDLDKFVYNPRMPRNNMRNTQHREISIRVDFDPELLKRFDEIAARARRTRAAHIAWLMEKTIEQQTQSAESREPSAA